MSKTKKIKTAVGVADRTDPYYALGSSRVESDKFWRWGDDNLFPAALALMARRSTTHRRIINDKADYISGKGFTCDEAQQPQLAAFVRCVNGRGESLRQVLGKLAFDKSLFGNAFLEAVTDPGHTFLSLYHQDASRCRVARDSKHVLLHHDWAAFKPAEARSLPLYPDFEAQEDGTLRSIVHYKDYEPMFEHYGVPPYIAGFSVSAIAWKTDRWNISRLDNSFQLSGVMMLDSSVDNEAEAERIVRLAEQKFAGNPGQVMFVIRDGGEDDNSRFIPIAAVADDEHHLPGVPGELLFGEPHDAFGLGLVVHRRVEHHHARQLERIVEARDVPAVGLPGDRRDAEPRDVGRHAVVFEHRFVILVMDDRAQRAVLLRFEVGVERQRARLGGLERRPVVVQQDVLRVAGHAAARGVLVVERQKGVPGVGDRFEERVAEQRLVEGQFAQHLAKALAPAVDAPDEGRQLRLLQPRRT